MPDRDGSRLDRVDTAQGFLALEADWNALTEASAHNVFLTHFWLSAWLDEFGQGRQPRVFTLRDGDGTLVAALPLVQSRENGIRWWKYMGAGVLTPNHLDVIALPEHRAAAVRRFTSAILEQRDAWDAVEIDKLPADSGTAEPMRAPFAGAGLATSLVTSAVCCHVDLPDTYDEYFASLKKKTRHNARNKISRLDRDRPGWTFGIVRTEEELSAALDALFRYHQERWGARGYAGAFGEERSVRFHRTVALQALRQGMLRFRTLTIDGDIAGLKYAFLAGDQLQAYQMCINERWAAYSPGTVLIAHAIEQAIAEGAKRYDALEGEEGYKGAWYPGRRENLRLRVFNRTLRGRLARAQERSAAAAVSAARRWLPAEVRESGVRLLSYKRAREE